MATDTEQLVVSLDELTLHAFEAFCEDIASMFGNTAECVADSAGQGRLSDLNKSFKKLASVNQVQAKGVLDGSFKLLLDQAGLFVLAGVFVMLPEKRILETIRSGTLKDADYINDAIKEVGNLLVGSWDRVFREEQQGHKHFKQTSTFVGSIWDAPEESIGLNIAKPCRYVICRMKVDNFPEFKCAAVFPEQLFETQAQSQMPQDAEPVAEIKPTPEVEAEPLIEMPAAEAQSGASEPQAVSPELPKSDASDEELTGISSSGPIDAEQKPGAVSEAIRKMTQQAEQDVLVNVAAVTSMAQVLSELSAGQIMDPFVLWVNSDDTVEAVLRQMQQHNVGYVLVGRDGKTEGLVSRSDIAAAISPYTRPVFAQWRRPLDDAALQIRIKWFMSRLVHTIRPETSLQAVLETMIKYSVRGLPVVDADGKTQGMVTVYDILGVFLASAGVKFSGRPQQAPYAG